MRSATPRVCFTAVFSAGWTLGRTDHHAPEAMVITELVRRATTVTERWEATEVTGAEDAVNADLGRPAPLPGMPGSELWGNVQLTLSAQARADAEQYRADRARVARLRYLKENLYNDPEMLLLDHLDRHPQDIGTVDIATFQRLSRSLRLGGQWWYPLLDCLETLSSELPARHGDRYAMKLLLKAFKDTLPELIDRHGLRDLADDVLGNPGGTTEHPQQ
ncbi:hypothetical protein [Streptomyces netropsis]|uniref:Uncharacterized protein n=1 Tax=Streptomyces netropsis TaxID=55404 RepID=A0A7W7LC34_STRNE|nr:hypothetical protein [Streptomyces netropsis]MBB4887469.1 hypothetical protein [Streptomyces netropsis]GGR10557.1 hypothetical protein GCM10010219_14060 [Streptomyces netropsis]